MTKFGIVYVSLGGNTKIVCDQIQKILEKKNHQVFLDRAELIDVNKFLENEVLVFACPTYGEGELETHFTKFLKKLKGKLKNKKSAIVALGDVNFYDDYAVASAQLIREFLKTEEADIIGFPLGINGSPVKFLDKNIPDWVNKLCEKIN